MCFSLFFPCITYFPYISLYTSNIALTISFSKITRTSSPMSAVRNDPGASITATSRPSIASIATVVRTNSFPAVGEIIMDFFNPFIFFHLSVTARPFIFSHFFVSKH